MIFKGLLIVVALSFSFSAKASMAEFCSGSETQNLSAVKVIEFMPWMPIELVDVRDLNAIRTVLQDVMGMDLTVKQAYELFLSSVNQKTGDAPRLTLFRDQYDFKTTPSETLLELRLRLNGMDYYALVFQTRDESELGVTQQLQCMSQRCSSLLPSPKI